MNILHHLAYLLEQLQKIRFQAALNDPSHPLNKVVLRATHQLSRELDLHDAAQMDLPVRVIQGTRKRHARNDEKGNRL